VAESGTLLPRIARTYGWTGPPHSFFPRLVPEMMVPAGMMTVAPAELVLLSSSIAERARRGRKSLSVGW